MEILRLGDTIERLETETTDEFQWEGVRPNETLRTALASTIERVYEIHRQDVEKTECTQFVSDGINLMIDVFNIRFSKSKYKPIYHGKLHAAWTLIHTMRSYVGGVELDAKSKLNNEFLRTLCIASLLHEIDEWWDSNASEEIDSQIKERISEFLEKYEISAINLSRILVLDDFVQTYDKRLETYLLNPAFDPTDPSYKPYLAKPGETLYLGENPDPQIIKYFEVCGKCLTGADFVQCLDLEYLEKMPVRTGVNDKDGNEIVLLIPKGAVCLAIEFFFLNPEALKSCGNGWGDKDGIDWFKVGSDDIFYAIFYKHFSSIEKAYAHYYETDIYEYLIVENLKRFVLEVEATHSRRSEYSKYARKFVPPSLAFPTETLPMAA